MRNPYGYSGPISLPGVKSVFQPCSRRFCPDPELYSPEILLHFSRCPELYRGLSGWTFRFVDPSQIRLEDKLALRRDDTIDEILAIMAEPVGGSESWVIYDEGHDQRIPYPCQRLRYSEDVQVLVLDGALNSVVLPTDNGDLEGWVFVLVDHAAELWA